MRVKSKLGLRLAAVGVVIGAAGLPLVGATAAHAAGPALTATPSTGLNNGSEVSVSGTGFGASTTAYLVECSGFTADTCDNGSLVTKATDGTGAFTASFPVEEGTVGTATGSACYPGDTCYIAVTTDPTDPTDTSQASATPITFAAATAPAAYVTPSTGLTNGQSLRVVGVDFTASHVYSVVECSGLTGAAACDSADATGGETDASGNLTTTFTAKTGTIGSDKGTCAAGSSNCYLIVDADPATPSDTTQVAFVNLTFAKATATGPKVTVTPAKNLKFGQKVTVAGSGFPQHNAGVFIVECSSLTKGAAYCDTGDIGTATTSSTGSFKGVKFTIASGTAFAKSGAKGSCAAGKTCYVVASTSTTGVKADAGGAAITLAKTNLTKIHTTVSAKLVKGHIVGAVKAKGKALKGIKVTLVRTTGQSGGPVTSKKTGKGGKYSFKAKKAGKYKVYVTAKTSGKTEYLTSHSKTITIK